MLTLPVLFLLRLPCRITCTFSHTSLSTIGVWAFSIYARLSFKVGILFLLLKPKRVDLKLYVNAVFDTIRFCRCTF